MVPVLFGIQTVMGTPRVPINCSRIQASPVRPRGLSAFQPAFRGWVSSAGGAGELKGLRVDSRGVLAAFPVGYRSDCPEERIMALSIQQQDAIEKWFKEHNLTPKCSLCGADSWKRDIVATLRATDASNTAGGIMSTGPGLLRMLRMTCGKCASIVMFDAARLGI